MFKVGDKVRVVSPESSYYRCIGTVVDVGGSISSVDFEGHVNLFLNVNLERINDLNISERLSEVIKENQNLKQQLSEQNIKLDKIQVDLKRELSDKGVSDDEFRESVDFWLKSSPSLIAEVWGEDYKNAPMSVMCDIPLSEFVNKYKEYKDKQDNEIRVGDEVIVKPNGYNAVVIAFATQLEQLTVFTKEHNTFEVFVSDVEKTGRHYDSIDSIDEFMRS